MIKISYSSVPIEIERLDSQWVLVKRTEIAKIERALMILEQTIKSAEIQLRTLGGLDDQ